MLTELTVERRLPYHETVDEFFTFTFEGPDREYIVKNIDGLGPVRSDLEDLTSVIADRANHVGSLDATRNIVLLLEFDPDYSTGSTITSLRQALDNVFIAGEPVHMSFTDSALGVVKIEGVVENQTPTIFSDSPETQISILCAEPYFVGSEESIEIPKEFFPEITYDGDALTSFTLEVDFTSDLTTFELYWLLTDDIWRASEDFLVGDKLTISTVPGDRKVELLRSAVTTSLLDVWSGDLDLRLRRGVNLLESLDYPNFDATITYNRMYGGL